MMIKVGRDNGMQIAQPCYVKYLRENEIQSVCNEIKAKAGNNGIDLVYCILPRVSWFVHVSTDFKGPGGGRGCGEPGFKKVYLSGSTC